MVVTRKGARRKATPLEESKRSWVQHVGKLEYEVGRKLLEKYNDPDADEEEAMMISTKKLEYRKKLKADFENKANEAKN